MEIDIKGALRKHEVGVVEVSRRLGVTRQTLAAAIDRGDGISVRKLEEIAKAAGCQITEFFPGLTGNQDFVAVVRSAAGEAHTFLTFEGLAAWVEEEKKNPSR